MSLSCFDLGPSKGKSAPCIYFYTYWVGSYQRPISSLEKGCGALQAITWIEAIGSCPESIAGWKIIDPTPTRTPALKSLFGKTFQEDLNKNPH